MVVVNDIGLVFRMTDTIVPDKNFRGDPQVFHPTLGAIMFQDFIVILDRDANPMDVRPQTDPIQMVRPANVAIHEAASTSLWLLFLDQNGKLLVNLRHEQMKPIEGAKPGIGRLLVFAPQLLPGCRQRCRPSQADSGRTRRQAGTAPGLGKGPGTQAGQAPRPGWRPAPDRPGRRRGRQGPRQ